ncbi:MAG: pyridoxamine 5'-phosphate oxidase family protein [Deltaproteobacteria bacterium]|nr:pyridoxamine 5'-phosphate oxidase family protein [Deltaproteobacteria bacterium]
MKETVQSWLRAARFGALGTLVDGVAFATLVPYALDAQGRPILVLSDIAVHTKALRDDARCSLLVHDPATDDPPQSWRATLVGRALVDDSARAEFQARHPNTPSLPGFHAWVIDVERTRYIEGFGRAGWC